MFARFGVLAVLVLAFAAACGGEEESEAEKEAAGVTCTVAPAALSGSPTLPTGFPTPDGVTYTAERDAGPSHIVEGYFDGEIGDAYDGYKSSLEDADGFAVTKDEQEEVDAEVNFEGGGSSGQVKLIQECEDRTSVSITARPE